MSGSPDNQLIELLESMSGSSREALEDSIGELSIGRDRLKLELSVLNEQILDLNAKKPTVSVAEQATIQNEVSRLSGKLLELTNQHGEIVKKISAIRVQIAKKHPGKN